MTHHAAQLVTVVDLDVFTCSGSISLFCQTSRRRRIYWVCWFAIQWVVNQLLCNAWQALCVATQYASAPCKLTMSSYLFARWHLFWHVGYLRHQQRVDLLTLKVVSESRVMWATSVPILVFLGLSIIELGPMYASDRQTDVRQKHRLMPLPYGGGGIINDDVIDVADLVTIRFRPN